MKSPHTERRKIDLPTEVYDQVKDWQYANRVPSLAEAVRRLLRIGIATSEAAEEQVAKPKKGRAR